jgi:hypothetical protein
MISTIYQSKRPASRSGRLTPTKKVPGTYFVQGYFGPDSRYGRFEEQKNVSHLPRFEVRTAHPKTGLSTDDARDVSNKQK